MKKFLLIAISTLILGACGTSRLVTNDDDDLYADPAKEKIEKERLAAKLKKEQEEEAARKQEELAKQKAKDDANPLYKDSEYNKDDYYDYQYASRVKRFGNAGGLGYYDNYYTNSYFYNNNPYSYGTSIYSSYNWNSPYGNYYSGLGYGCGGFNSFGNSYGYNNGYYNGYNNGYYSGYNNYPYGYGYNAYNGYGYNPYGYNPYGYNNYNNNWGYYNSYDVNSKYKNMTYGVRGGHGGGNSSVTSTGGKDEDYVMKYMQGVAQKQENTPKFTEFAKPVKTNGFDNSNFNSGNSGSGFSKQNNTNSGSNSGFINDNNNSNRNSFNSVNNGDYNNVNRNNDGSGNTITKPTFKNSMNSDNNPTIITPNNNNNSPRINTGSEPAKIGGGNTPAISLPNVGGGGVSRPR